MIEDLIKTIQNDPPEHHATFIHNACTKIHGWFSENLGRDLYNLAKDDRMPEGEIVEIGSFKGCSAVCLGLGAHQVKQYVWTVDPHPQWVADKFNGGLRTVDMLLKNISLFEVDDIVIPIVGKSETAIKIWNRPIRLLFVDGEHTTESVIKDYGWAEMFIVPGGVVVFHDSHVPTVKEGIDRTIRQNTGFIEIPLYESVAYFVRKGNEWWLK